MTRQTQRPTPGPMRRSPQHVGVAGLSALLLLSCGEPEEQAPPMKTPPADDDDDGEATGDTGVETPREPGEASDRCAEAPGVGEGRHLGSLRGNLAELGGACGGGGPDAFFRVEVPFRADVFVQAVGVGFAPKVGVLPAGCSNDWSHRTLACTQSVGVWLLDFAAGTSLVASVGADPEEPQLQLPAPEEGDDPLDFALDVQFRNVLGIGDPCEPASRGRCGTGTTCTASDDAPTAVCTVLPADSCAYAEPLAVGFGTTLVEVPAAVPHTDAHAHSCTGAHRPDRVYALDLPAAMVARDVVVTTESDAIGLAIRAASCLPADERDCAPPQDESGDGGTEVSAVIEGSGDDRVFVFVELPPAGAPQDGTGDGSGDGSGDGAGEEAPIPIEVTVTLAPER